jgi:hypothetical protein
VGTVGLTLIFDLSARGGSVTTAGMILGVGLAMTFGYGLALLGMRPWLFPDACPDAMRSFLAGILSSFAVFVALVAGLGFGYLPILSVAMGMVCAIGLFFAWLTPTPAEMRDARFLDQLSDEDGAGRAS